MIAWPLLLVFAQAPSPAGDAYQALHTREYDRAITLFREAVAASPANPALRKDLAYALLKIGDTESARDQFGEAARLDASDRQAALEYAFLCFETNRRAEARRIFDRLRKQGSATAAEAFGNIDRPLAEGIDRWGAVVEQAPENLSARRELARLAEERDELALAAENYLAAWRLRPTDRDLLVGLGRVWKTLGRAEQASAALLAASRGSSPRAADQARELLPPRYPYVNEFRRALELDPANVELRRELAYLLLAMGRQPEAEAEFARTLEVSSGDRLSAAQLGLLLLARGERDPGMRLLAGVLAGEDALSRRVRDSLAGGAKRWTPQSIDVRSPAQLGDVSYKTGMTQDALRHFTMAYQKDPFDFNVMLKLGWTLNVLKDDARAAGWFRLASKSPDPVVASEATQAYRNLRPSKSRLRTTVWAFPIWSSRWHDAFSYAQAKTELRTGIVRPYLSVRFIGNTRQPGDQALAEAAPQYLSETALVFAAGLATRPWRGAILWAEAGEAVSYVRRPGRAKPDYRGGVAFGRHFGAPLGGEARGMFAETSVDGVFLSRFDNDFLAYWQTRAGYTLPDAGPLRWQVYANANLTGDARGQAWANLGEVGPGLRFRLEPLPATFSVNLLRGAYTRGGYEPRGPNFVDLRIGLWYAFSR
ncbi:MAG TPA: tetratricopeptide repeat protein [Bryobacteraceae bacterium]|nr:tetratricopeptide repeat protein [Bryobacteraceae bacterium]